ncbi:MAG: Uma2 family endonuclease [Planctomycetota bacterium]|nr:Uma2 family endonuclease [Planctomycetota bacterium]
MSTKTNLTYADYVAIPDDGCRHEIIDGDHFVNPAPNLYHQHVSRHLQLQLLHHIELAGLGVVINAPVDLQLGEHDIVQPDLVFVSHARRWIMTPSRIKGIPDLVVEILSPSNSEHDTKLKRSLYESFGVPEYWIVFPDDHQLLQLVLAGGVYVETLCNMEVVMSVSPHTRVDLKKVW